MGKSIEQLDDDVLEIGLMNKSHEDLNPKGVAKLDLEGIDY